MITKIRKKASHFWKHGKHAKILPQFLQQPQKKKKEKVFNSVKELMSYRRKRI